MTQVTTTSASERQRSVATLTTAFSSDPLMRWFFPSAHDYLAYFSRFVDALAGRAFEHETAYHAGDFAGAALWLPPGVESDGEGLGALITTALPEHRQPSVVEFGEQVEAHHPTEPVWYLPLIGVDPTGQGRGYGSALLEHALEICDADHVPAYLESSNDRNIPLYERFGFEVTGEIRVDDSPPLWPMLRPAR